MTQIIKLLRIQQWAKNLFVFIPAFFAGTLFYENNIFYLLASFISFCLISSAIYILNDYRDIESDRKHPIKVKRPLASGRVSTTTALVIFILFLAGGMTVAYITNFRFLAVLLMYFLLNVGYSFGLKNISILDIFIIASGFLLRTVAGGVVVSIQISQWLVIMVFLLSLFLALAKRRDDILMFLESGKVIRKTVQEYNLDFVNVCLTMISAVIIVAYIMYSISPDVTERLRSEQIFFTSLFVIAGMMRYLQITIVEKKSGSPTKVLYTDKFIIVTLLGWLLSFYVIIYIGPL